MTQTEKCFTIEKYAIERLKNSPLQFPLELQAYPIHEQINATPISRPDSSSHAGNKTRETTERE